MPSWLKKIGKKIGKEVNRSAKKLAPKIEKLSDNIAKEVDRSAAKLKPKIKKLGKNIEREVRTGSEKFATNREKDLKKLKELNSAVKANGGWVKAPEMLLKFNKVDDDLITEVIPGFLYLSNKSRRDDVLNGNNPYGINEVLSLLSADSDNLNELQAKNSDINVNVVPIQDNVDSKLLKYVDETNALIKAAKQNSQKILVHCKDGMSRSPAVVIAYMIKHEPAMSNHDYQTAFNNLKYNRGFIAPNAGFIKQLKSYAENVKSEIAKTDSANASMSNLSL